jgi:hypothetical protein
VEEFLHYHIPEATLKCKADEFHELRQGNKSVEEYTYQFIELARYARRKWTRTPRSRRCSRRD